MKTLKFLFLFTALSALWQTGQAQCAKFNLWQSSPGSDTVVINPYTLISLADSASASWTIDFGDGYIQPVYGQIGHVYNATGSFNICLTYTSALCTDTYCDSIYVQHCGTVGPMTVSQSTTSGVTSLSVNGAPPGSTYSWNLNGATPSSSTSATPSATYPANNMYNNYVWVTEPGGCTQYVPLTVSTYNNCNAAWNKQQYGNDVNFSPANYYNGATYTWSFGDGQTNTDMGADHTYSGYGAYTVCLKIETAGCTDSVCHVITTVAPPCPSSDSLFISYPTVNGGIQFTSIAADSFLYTQGTYYMDFGDGNSGNTYLNNNYRYTANGTYVACLTYTSAYCNVTQCDTVTPDMCNVATSIGYSSYSQTGYYYLTEANPAWTYQWLFPGGTPSTSTNTSEYVTYPAPGSYSAYVVLTVPGCVGTDTFSAVNYILGDSCNAGFSYNVNNLNLNLYPYDSSYLMQGEGYFDYGDGTTSINPNHTYSAPGTYNVAYIVYTAYCADSVTRAVTVTDGSVGCSAYFHYTYNTSLVYFYPTDSATRIFDYGDGSTGNNTAHLYANYGTYDVCLISTTQTCSDTFCTQVVILPPMTNIFGTIAKQGGPACNAEVFLIKDSLGYLSLVDTYIISDSSGCTGSYYFNLYEGTYYVKARLLNTDPDYADYLPTYYGDELSWTDANPVVTTTTNGPWSIALIAGLNPGGPGFIGGNVSEGAGLAAIGNGEERAVGDPIANVQINLLTDNGVAVAYTYTDGNGRYTFNNLQLGGYKVHAEMLEKTPMSQVVTLTANNPSQDNVDVLVNSNSAITDINDIADIKVDGVFPNPVSENTTLQFTAKQSANADMKITDMKGAVVMSRQIAINTGANKIDVNLSNHAAGVYHLSITNNANSKTIKLIKAN